MLDVPSQLFYFVCDRLCTLTFLHRSMSLKCLRGGYQPKLTMGWSEVLHLVERRAWPDCKSALFSLFLSFHCFPPSYSLVLRDPVDVCSYWMGKLMDLALARQVHSQCFCLFQLLLHSEVEHSAGLFSLGLFLGKRFFHRDLEKAVSVIGETFWLENSR